MDKFTKRVMEQNREKRIAKSMEWRAKMNAKYVYRGDNEPDPVPESTPSYFVGLSDGEKENIVELLKECGLEE